MDFTGKVIVVTGASSGIGAATAKLFAAHGACLAIIGRNEDRLTSVARTCESYQGKRPLCLLLDLTDKDSCKKIARSTFEMYKRIDILINCAGNIVPTSLFDLDMDNYDEFFALNVRVPYGLTQTCLPYLVESKGHVVNVFQAPLAVTPGLIVSGMFSDAMEQFTRASAVELVAKGVKMNAVRPGYTRTNYLAGLNLDLDSDLKLLEQILPNKTMIEPEEIAKTIVMVASGMLPNLNAASIIVDGAVSAVAKGLGIDRVIVSPNTPGTDTSVPLAQL